MGFGGIGRKESRTTSGVVRTGRNNSSDNQSGNIGNLVLVATKVKTSIVRKRLVKKIIGEMLEPALEDTRIFRAVLNDSGKKSNLLTSPLQETQADSNINNYLTKHELKGKANKQAFKLIYEQLKQDSTSSDKGTAYKTKDLQRNAMKMTKMLGIGESDYELSKGEILAKLTTNDEAKKLIHNVDKGTELKINNSSRDLKEITDRLVSAKEFVNKNKGSISKKSLMILEKNISDSISWVLNKQGLRSDKVSELNKELEDIKKVITKAINNPESNKDKDKELEHLRTFLNKSLGDFWTTAKFISQQSNTVDGAVQIKFSALVSGINQAMLQDQVQAVGTAKKVSLTSNNASLQSNEKPQVQVKKMKMDMSKIYSESDLKNSISVLKNISSTDYLDKLSKFRQDLGISEDVKLDSHLETILDNMMVKRDLLELKIKDQLKTSGRSEDEISKQAKTIVTKVIKGYADTLATSEKSLRRLETASWTVDNNDNFQQRRTEGKATKAYIGKLDPVKAYAENAGIVDLNYAGLTKEEKAILDKFTDSMVFSDDSSRLSFDFDALPTALPDLHDKLELVLENKIYDVNVTRKNGQIEYSIGVQTKPTLDEVIKFINNPENKALESRFVESKKIITVGEAGNSTNGKIIHDGNSYEIKGFTQGTEFQVIGLPESFSNILADVMSKKVTLDAMTPLETTVKPESWNSTENDWDKCVDMLRVGKLIEEKDGKVLISSDGSKLEETLKNLKVSKDNILAFKKKLFGDAKMNEIEEKCKKILKDSLFESSSSQAFTDCLTGDDEGKSDDLYNRLEKSGAITLTGRFDFSKVNPTEQISPATLNNFKKIGQEQALMCDFFNDATLLMRVTLNQEIRNLIESGDFVFVREKHGDEIKNKFIPISNFQQSNQKPSENS
jgi:hypothetical protein